MKTDFTKFSNSLSKKPKVVQFLADIKSKMMEIMHNIDDIKKSLLKRESDQLEDDISALNDGAKRRIIDRVS